MDKRLLVPVYLNQRIVFDLLAMLQGGLSTVVSVSQSKTSSAQEGRESGASFGVSEVLSTLLKVDLSGRKSSSSVGNVAEATSEERVHTPASLLYQLRNQLHEMGAVSNMSSLQDIKSGDFIEFEASLLRNPLIETMDRMSKLMDLAMLFEDNPTKAPGKGRSNQASNENRKIKAQMDQFSDSLRAGNTMDLITGDLPGGITAVLTLEKHSLNDPLMADLVDGKFRVLGKVIRRVVEDDDAISLVRNNALSNLPRHILENLGGVLGELGSQHDLAVPVLRWDIEAPAIQVIPIAIYA